MQSDPTGLVGDFLSRCRRPEPALCTSPLPHPASHAPREGLKLASFL